MVMDSPHANMSVFDILKNCRSFDYYVYDKIEQFKNDMNFLKRLKPRDAVAFIKTDLEYEEYLERMQDEGRNNLSNSLHILEILEEIGSYCENLKEFIDKIYSLQDVIKNASENKEARITLATIHGAKGLEYDNVYLIDNIDGEFPSDKRNMSQEKYEEMLEEERRIFYVGMTRAKSTLNIIVPGIPSVFVNELVYANKKIQNVNMRIGQDVVHTIFGNGTIADIQGNTVYIKFDGGKTRSLDINISLEKNLIKLM
jgi:DNA helicase-2/ATP-dependent DNA helicase PcrA